MSTLSGIPEEFLFVLENNYQLTKQIIYVVAKYTKTNQDPGKN